MLLHIDYNSSEPISRQVADQIKLLVVNGRLRSGDRLPSIRELAGTLRINPTTVSRIYNQLGQEGVVTLRQGQGVFVARGLQRLAPEEVKRVVNGHARTLLVEGLRQGLSYREIRGIIKDEYCRIKGGDE